MYLLAMIGVMTTAIPLTLSRALEGKWVGAIFLGYLVVLVAHACRSAWLAVRYKQDFKRYTGIGLRVSTAALGATGLGVTLIGLVYGAWLLVVFGLIGPITALGTVSLIRKGPQTPRWWLKEHYSAMIANGVATHIAFLQIGLTRVFPELGGGMIQHLAWFGPLAVSLVAGRWLSRRYMQPRSSRSAGVNVAVASVSARRLKGAA
jgi:mannose/fructose/N-acetylgalactosamine-specific phosphotransferase system component IID